jgi:hypothetical protein
MMELLAGVLVEAVGAVLAAFLVRLLHRWIGWSSSAATSSAAG